MLGCECCSYATTWGYAACYELGRDGDILIDKIAGGGGSVIARFEVCRSGEEECE